MFLFAVFCLFTIVVAPGKGGGGKTPTPAPTPAPAPGPTAIQSSGCSLSPRVKGGRTYSRTLEWTPTSGRSTSYQVTIPSNYENGTPVPVVFFHHGWGGSSGAARDWVNYAKNSGFMVVSATGYGDGGPNSWTGFGSTDDAASYGGETCIDRDGSYPSDFNYCYDSCVEKYGDCDRLNTGATCWWTSCESSVDMTSNLLDEIEANWCVDIRRMWATGTSNGGMYTYELMTNPLVAARFAGFLPNIGSPHPGFLENTPLAVTELHFFGLWGRRDGTVPPLYNSNRYFIATEDRTIDSSFGWLYLTSRKTTEIIADTLALNDRVSVDYTSFDSSLQCSQRSADGTSATSSVVECTFGAGHVDPSYMAQILWSYASQRWNLSV